MSHCKNCNKKFGATYNGKRLNAQPIYICPEATLAIICTDCCETLSVEKIMRLGEVWFDENHTDTSFAARSAAAEGKCHFRWDVEYLKGEREVRPFVPAPLVID